MAKRRTRRNPTFETDPGEFIEAEAHYEFFTYGDDFRDSGMLDSPYIISILKPKKGQYEFKGTKYTAIIEHPMMRLPRTKPDRRWKTQTIGINATNLAEAKSKAQDYIFGVGNAKGWVSHLHRAEAAKARKNPAELSLHEIQGMKKAELVKAILSFTQAPIVMGKGAKAYLQKQRVSKLQRMLALHLHPHAERYRRERYAAWGNPKKTISQMTKKELIETLLLYDPNLDVAYLAKKRVGALRDFLTGPISSVERRKMKRSSPAYKMSPRLKAILRRKRQEYIDLYGHPPPVRARKNARPAWRWGAGDPESHALGGRLPNAPREAVERFAEVRDIGESVKDLQFQLSRVQGKKQKHERQRSDLRRAIDSANRDLESVQREVRDEILEKYDYDKSDKVGDQAANALRSVFFQSVRSNPVNYHIEDRWMANPRRPKRGYIARKAPWRPKSERQPNQKFLDQLSKQTLRSRQRREEQAAISEEREKLIPRRAASGRQGSPDPWIYRDYKVIPFYDYKDFTNGAEVIPLEGGHPALWIQPGPGSFLISPAKSWDTVRKEAHGMIDMKIKEEAARRAYYEQSKRMGLDDIDIVGTKEQHQAWVKSIDEPEDGY